MSTKNKKARKVQLARQSPEMSPSPEQDTHVLDTPQRHKLAENDVENGFFRLTRRQQAALPFVALAPSITQAAAESGVSQRTLYRWFQDSDFRQAVSSFLEECASLASQQLQGQALLAASVFADLMKHDDPSLRLRAARYSVALALRYRQADQLASDVRDIKEALALEKN